MAVRTLPMLYRYAADVVSVYDGDTITVDIQLGFGITLNKQKVRLADVDTPELRGADKVRGKEVRDWVRAQILNKRIIIVTSKDEKGKYGRWLGEVFFTDSAVITASTAVESLRNLNTELVERGMAVRWT